MNDTMNDQVELNLELELQAWLDGELSAPEARRIGPKIVGDAEAGRLITELQAIKRALAGNEIVRAVPETRALYWGKIERQIQRPAPGPRAVSNSPIKQPALPSTRSQYLGGGH